MKYSKILSAISLMAVFAVFSDAKATCSVKINLSQKCTEGDCGNLIGSGFPDLKAALEGVQGNLQGYPNCKRCSLLITCD